MIKLVTFCLTLFLTASVTPAGAEDYLELSLGKASEGLDVYRVAWRKPWANSWLVSETGELSGFHSVSFNYWVE